MVGTRSRAIRGKTSNWFSLRPKRIRGRGRARVRVRLRDFRTIGRKEKRAIEHQIFLEISSSYLVFVLQSYSSSSSTSTSAVAGQGENLQQIKLALMGLKPWAEIWSPFREEICTAYVDASLTAPRSLEFYHSPLAY